MQKTTKSIFWILTPLAIVKDRMDVSTQLDGASQLPTLDDLVSAQKTIADVACKTPLVMSPSLSRRFGKEIYLKLECFQPIRVFKIRGAYNKVSQINSQEIVAVSSGNHGLAVAYCSRLLAKECTVILPKNPIPEKVHAILETGAKVVKIAKSSEREERARQMVRQRGAVYVHPFNDPAVIAGAGTCGLEIAQQLSDFDSVIVPVGGGGLISGISIAIKSLKPSAKVFGVEPIAAPKLQAAMNAGKVVNLDSPKSIADGLIPSSVGDLTLKACVENVEGVFSASDSQIVRALKLLIREAYIFPEPSGAASLAPLLSRSNSRALGKKVVLVISGGNISLNFLRSLLRSKNR